MIRFFIITLWYFLSLCTAIPQVSIIYPQNGSFHEELASREIRKYIYLRTDVLIGIQSTNKIPVKGDIILVAQYDHPLLSALQLELNHEPSPQGFIIKTIENEGRKILIVTGNDGVSTLHGAYRFAEHLGIAFDLAGDIIPDQKIQLDISGFDEVGQPILDIIGILPFHDFHQGPDLWNTEDYRAIISQLPKMGMNFIGLHNYHRWSGTTDKKSNIPQGPEPNVWIGLPGDINNDGSVRWSYPAFYAHTHRPDRIWGFAMRNTDLYHAGAQGLFALNGYDSDVMGTSYPQDVQASNQVFNKVGIMLNNAFRHARNIGIKTAVGTELPMGLEPKGPEVNKSWIRGIPPELQLKLSDNNMDPKDHEVIKTIYRGIFERIMKTHPLDYYWLWSWEVWSNYGVNKAQIKAFKTDIMLAEEALEDLGNPFQLGLAGWRIGTVDNHAEFDDILPPKAPFYGLWDEAEGMEMLQPERIKWAATWAEEDWGLLQPQLELHRIYNDAEAAVDKKTNGLIAKHWRTRILGANLGSMKDLLWVYGPAGQPLEKTIQKDKNLWIREFYLEWAGRNFGTEVAIPVADIISALDIAGEPGSPGAIPNVTGWDSDEEDSDNGAPGAINAIEESWEKEKEKYSFVSQLEEIRSKVIGKGNLYRFDYWLKSMQVMRLLAEYGTLKYQFEEKMNAEDWEGALIHRIEMARLFERIMTLEIEKMVNTSDLGEIINLEILNWYQLMILKWDKKLSEGLGAPIPDDANPSSEYKGDPFIKAATSISQIYKGEDFRLKTYIMGDLKNPVLKWRYLGEKEYRKAPIKNIGRSVFEVEIVRPSEDFEYYMEASSGNDMVVYPATSPDTNAAVIVIEEPIPLIYE
jgi:hypothetical protein